MNRIFIASSGDLAEERKEFEILLFREGFQPVIWESIDQSITTQRFQDRINEDHLHTSDIVIFMVKSRLGSYTEEEFKEAYNNLGNTVDRMYVYFFDYDRNKIDDGELLKILSLQKYLREEEKLYHKVENFDKLKNHFHEQRKFFEVKKKPDESIVKESEEKEPKQKLRLLTNLPPVNENFIGREEDLKTIEEMLENDSLTYIVNGIGGVGKSELSYRYLHNNKDRYNAIAFIEVTKDTSSIEDIFYTKFKEEFGLDENTTFDTIIKILQRLPEKNLLLIDNLETKEDFEKIKSLNTNFDLLITTRLTNIDTKYQLNLETLNDKDARELFLSIYDKDHDIDSILEYLDNHPLFITLTAKSLKQGYITLEELRENINNHTITKIDSTDDMTFKQHLEDTFDRQFKKEKNQELKHLLQIISIFPSIEIDFQTFEKSLQLDGLRVKLQKLVDRGWLTKKEDSYKLHQIIRTFIQEDYKLDYDEIKFVFENIGNYIDPDDLTLIASQLKHYIPILEHLINTYKDKKDDFLCKLLDSLTFLYYSIAKYSESMECQELSLEIRKILFGVESIIYAKSLNLIGVILNQTGNVDKSLEYYERALLINKKILGENDHAVATNYGNIGEVWNSKGIYDKSLEYYEKGLKVLLNIYGEKNAYPAMIYNKIGVVWNQKGIYSKSLEYHEKALSIYEIVLTGKHTIIATCYNDLGMVYKNTSAYDKSLEYYEKSLHIYISIFGDEHPYVATSYNNIGAVFNSKKQYDKAIEYFEKALKIRKTFLGEYHSETATSYSNIGLSFDYKGKYRQAVEYYEKALVIKNKVLDGKHHETAITCINMSLSLLKLKKCIKAQEFATKALEILKENEYQQDLIYRANQILKQTSFNIKKEKLKRKRKYCKD